LLGERITLPALFGLALILSGLVIAAGRLPLRGRRRP
jgi:drug/metabolite transporter (DMT)-like permease